MANQNKKWENEKGLALIIAVLITSALVAIGSFAMVMTNTELDISKNDRFSKEAFYLTDSAGSVYTNIIDTVFWFNTIDTLIDTGTATAVVQIAVDDMIENEIYNFDRGDPDLNDGPVDNPGNSPDITITLIEGSRQKIVNVDVDWRFRHAGKGGSLLTHQGYDGVGQNKSFGGSVAYFDIQANGRTASLARTRGVSTAQIQSVYRR